MLAGGIENPHQPAQPGSDPHTAGAIAMKCIHSARRHAVVSSEYGPFSVVIAGEFSRSRVVEAHPDVSHVVFGEGCRPALGARHTVKLTRRALPACDVRTRPHVAV